MKPDLKRGDIVIYRDRKRVVQRVKRGAVRNAQAQLPDQKWFVKLSYQGLGTWIRADRVELHERPDDVRDWKPRGIAPWK